MKHLWIGMLCVLMFAPVLWAQNKDSSQVKEQEQKKQSTEQVGHQQQEKEQSEGEQVSRKDLQGFVDQNANGIDDRLEGGQNGKGKGKGQPRDRFVDTDGDGICDGKESAIGLRKLFRKRQGHKSR